tara:strand:+ start:1817 stop:2197 length:381 start_codon:yes stop_codon:yes gene_type:complete
MYFLLILSLKSILSSVIGSSFYNWFQGTTGGIWFQKQVDRFMAHFADKYDLELAKKDAKFRKQYPLAAERLDQLEKNSHPCKELHEFDVYPELMDRIESIEEDLNVVWEVNARQIAKHLAKKPVNK